MTYFIKIILIFLFVLSIFSCRYHQSEDFLQIAWNKQVNALKGKHLKLYYEESKNELEHSFEPWQQTNYKISGEIWNNSDAFIKTDTLKRRNRVYHSKTELNNDELLYIDYGDEVLFKVTQSQFFDHMLQTARYSPITLLNYFKNKQVLLPHKSDDEHAIYETEINKNIIKLYIRKLDGLVAKITILSDDDLFGDVLSTLTYSNYSLIDHLPYPKSINIEKINSKLKDEVTIKDVTLLEKKPKALRRPENYIMLDDIVVNKQIEVKKYNDNIHFLELVHTDDRVMVVEFEDFLLVAEAPLNSENGELIIDYAKKIAPNKPIKYFAFGHYHPHYLGGVRAFIHIGANIITSNSNEDYIRYIANATHSLSPDNLQLQPQPLHLKTIHEKLKITDGKFEMYIYFIGEKSKHTKDYLIYYFPKEKMLFQDDLVWINKTGEIKKSGDRQTGLYQAILSLGLDVETIIQSWPIADHGVKTVIPFQDLEASVKLK